MSEQEKSTTQWVVAWAGDESGSVIEVTASGAAAQAVAAHADALVEAKVASGIAAQDPTLWGPAAESEAAIRLAWVDLATSSRDLLEPLAALRAELQAEGVDRVVLAGMGGSSLAPEVITRTAGVPLVVLDSTDPRQVREALDADLARTVLVVSSKSGTTLETDSQRKTFEAAFTAAGLDPRRHIVVVTDPGSPMEAASRAAGYRAVFTANSHVGGRFSALTAFGLVPSALAGVDVAELLDEAAAVASALGEDTPANPGIVLGAAIGGTVPLRDKLVIVDEGSGIVGLGDWAEQLIAESTGKDGKGLLPVVTGTGTAQAAANPPELEHQADDVLAVRLVPAQDESDSAEAADTDAGPATVTVAGPLGAQMLLWEYATSIAGRLLGINPFDQPDVESAKSAARGLLTATPEPEAPAFVDGDIEVYGPADLLEGVADVQGALAAAWGALQPHGYVAVNAYLDREAYASFAAVRDSIAERTGRPTTFGWGPRFLHSTGQMHKGGPATGVFLQITGTEPEDLDIPDAPFTFGQVIAAQAAGDAGVLRERGRVVLRLHLRSPETGLERLSGLL